ncbi:MAG TPA: TlpA family protein disulfide reductase [Polyangiaceae bacterium]|jgi:hypothetical protein|nr:TlpA family protein disulfide reductase [Polyangiaceae bacterium]
MRAFLPLCALMVACTSGSGDPAIPLPGSGNTGGDEEYPAPPYTVTTKGGLIEPLEFLGYARPADGLGNPVTIKLAELFNPTGEGTYAAGSPFGEGEPKPSVLVISVAGVWCSPCKYEADVVLPEKYEAFHSRGLEIFGLLADGQTPVAAGGEPATIEELETWIETFDSPYPSVLEPLPRPLAVPFGTALPGNLIIDTKTMTIRERIAGQPTEGFWLQVEELLRP